MRVALLLLCLLCFAGCPRQSSETVPVAHVTPQPNAPPMAPTSSRQVTPAGKLEVKAAQAPAPKAEIKAVRLTAPEIKPPIDYLELGSGFKPAMLPHDVQDEFPSGKLSSDKAELGVTESGETIWLQGFTTRASDAEIGSYYGGLLGVKGFETFKPGQQDLNKGKKGKTKKKAMRSWRSPDHRFEVFVYDSGQLSTPTGAVTPRPVYIVEVHDRPATAHGGTGP